MGAVWLIQKSAEFNIDLNAKDKYGTDRMFDRTAFHLACENGHSKIVAEMLIQKSAELNISECQTQVVWQNCFSLGL